MPAVMAPGSSFRARAGFLVDDNIMIYGTGGIAFANASLDDTFGQTVVRTFTDTQCASNCTTSRNAGGFAFAGADNASVSEVVADGDRIILRRYNDVAHLLPLLPTR